MSSEVADGRARNSGSLTGDARDDDDEAAAVVVAAAAVAAAAAEHAFVVWPTTSSPMVSNPKTSRPLPNLKSQYFQVALHPPPQEVNLEAATASYHRDQGEPTFKCPSSALLLPNVAPQHPGTGHMRRCSALTCQASALLEVKLAAEHEVQVQVKACSAR